MKKVYKIFFIHKPSGVPMDLLWAHYDTYEEAEAEIKNEIEKREVDQVFVILTVYIKM